MKSPPTDAQLGRPVGANGGETRRRIMTAAMRCVAEVGYSQATIREIARAADMTSGSLYHYFPNKSELLKATVTQIEDIALPRLRAAAARADTAANRLDAVLDETDRMLREHPYLAGFERAMRAETRAHLRGGEPTDSGFKALRSIIADIVEDARARGELASNSDPRAAEAAIYALMRGLAEQAATLSPEGYRAALVSTKRLVRGTLFTRRTSKAGRGQ